MIRFLALIVLSIVGAMASAQLTSAERQGLANALFLRNLTPKDLDFVRRDPAGATLLPAVEEAIDHPLEGADALLRLHAAAAGGGLADVLGLAQAQLRVPPGAAVELPPAALPPSVPAPLRAPVGKIVAAMGDANEQIRLALGALSTGERRTLINSLPQLAVGGRVAIGLTQGAVAPAGAVQALLARVDLIRLIAAGSVLAHRVEAELPLLRAAAGTAIPATLSFSVNGVPVELSGAGSDVHRGLVGGLCIDLGGDNHYLGRYGAGLEASSVLIDFGGTATYDVPDLSVGAGLLGVGLAYEFADRAHFSGKSLTFGAGLAGVGALFRQAGDDTYSSVAMSQGFGSRGIGLLVDTGGDDEYRLAGLGQGAGTDGGLGWLVDRAGNDVYITSGFTEGSYAQGFGRGGVGLLTDLSGDDIYRGTSRCQGVGDRFGVGSLYDASGKDAYFADSSAQGFASDTGGGFLFDLAGDDTYCVRGGACHGTAQSRSVAFLLDRAGNDYYAEGDGRPGLATDGGVAIFLDAQGDDRYVSTPSGSVPGRYGDALGIFVDLGGEDGYAEGLDNGQARIELDGAVANDVAVADSTAPIENFGPVPGGTSDPGPAQIDMLADAGTETAANRLVAIGAPAYRRLMQRPIAGVTPPVFTAIVRLGHALRQNAFAAVMAKLNGPDVDEQRRALYLAASFGMGGAAERIQQLLKEPATRHEAAEAAGLLRLRSALPDLLLLTGSEDSSLALAAMLAVERIGDEAGIPAAQALVVSPEFPIRQSALRLLAHFSASATVTAQRLVADPNERLRRIGIELYGRMGTEEALTQAAQFLTATTPGLRIQAMLAIDGHCPAPYRPTLAALRFDPDAAVRAVAARIDPGR